MWAIANQTPFAADRAFVRDRDGSEVWLTILRASFQVEEDGSTRPADEQSPVCLAPEHFEDPATSSLRQESDLALRKTATDIVLIGQAWAPHGEPAPEVPVSMELGSLRKDLRVVGDRVWEKKRLGGLRPSQPELFSNLPIRYERAFGGVPRAGSTRSPFQENPIGSGLDAEAGDPVWNIEHPDQPAAVARGDSRAAGFGAVAGHWLPRAAHAGTYDTAWEETRQPLLPVDFDEAYWQCAPLDQRAPGFLRGGERVRLVNLTPEGELEFELPRLRFGFRTAIADRDVDHRAELHTVILEPDERRVTLVWSTSLPCHHTLYKLRETTIFEKELLA